MCTHAHKCIYLYTHYTVVTHSNVGARTKCVGVYEGAGHRLLTKYFEKPITRKNKPRLTTMKVLSRDHLSLVLRKRRRRRKKKRRRKRKRKRKRKAMTEVK